MDNKEIRILYAEDEARPAAEFHAEMFKRGFTQITHVKTGSELQEVYQSNPNTFDIIVTDYNMDGIYKGRISIDGLEALTEIKGYAGEKDSIPAIMFSSSGTRLAEITKGMFKGIDKDNLNKWDVLEKTILSSTAGKKPQPRPETPPAPPPA